MISISRLKTADGEIFARLGELYEEAFPIEERRDLPALDALIRNEERMVFNAVECDGQLAGLLVYWDFGDFYYLEHLAVFSQMRNLKIGKQVLDWVSENLTGLRILEVEPEGEEMATRRIHYYERNGYAVCERKYHQPAYRAGGEGIDLWIMCNQSDSDLSSKLERLKAAVYAK